MRVICKNSKLFSPFVYVIFKLLHYTHTTLMVKTIVKGLPQPEPTQFQCEECGKILNSLTVCNDCMRVPFCSNECVNKCKSHVHFCKPKEFGMLSPEHPVSDLIDGTEWFLVAKRDIKYGEQVMVDDPLMVFSMLDDPHAIPETLKHTLFGPEKLVSRYHHIDDPELFGEIYRDIPDVNISDQDMTVKMVYALCKEHTWLTLEKSMRLTWKDENLNENHTSHRKLRVDQSQLIRISATVKGVCPLDIYRVGFHMGPSLTQVYARGTGDVALEGLFMNAWKLTKSCNPNCIVFMFQGKLIVSAIKNIKEGESISIGFNAITQSKGYRDRTNKLKLIYGIKDCICDRCVSEALKQEPQDSDNQMTWISDVNFKDERSNKIINEFLETLNIIVNNTGGNLMMYLDSDLDGTLRSVTFMNNDDFIEVYRSVMFLVTSYISTALIRCGPWIKEMILESEKNIEAVPDILSERMNELEGYRQQLIQKLRFKYGVAFYCEINTELDTKSTQSVYIEGLLNALIHTVKMNEDDVEVLYQLYQVQSEVEKAKLKETLGGISENHASQVQEIRESLKIIREIINLPVLYYDMAMMNIEPGVWDRNCSYYVGKQDNAALGK